MGEDKDRDIFKAVLEEMHLPYGREDGLTIYKLFLETFDVAQVVDEVVASVKSTAVGLM